MEPELQKEIRKSEDKGARRVKERKYLATTLLI